LIRFFHEARANDRYWQILLQKLAGGVLGATIESQRFLNRHCASGLDPESILLARMRKIFLQPYRHDCDVVLCRLDFRWRLSGRGAETLGRPGLTLSGHLNAIAYH
jgi:hypothetical protein